MNGTVCLPILITRPDGGVAIMQYVTERWGAIEENLFKLHNELRAEQELPPLEENYFKLEERDTTRESIEAEFVRAGITFISWRLMHPDEAPHDRSFRNAWIDTGRKIDHDMSKARDIHMGRIREARDRKLGELDKQWLRATGQGKAAETREIEAKRQALRDIPQTINLTEAKTVEELKEKWPDELK